MDLSEFRRKALLFQLSSCQGSLPETHQMYKDVQNIHVLIQVCVLKVLCLSSYSLQGCSVKVSESVKMCESS